MAIPIVERDADGRRFTASNFIYAIPPVTSLAPLGSATPVIQIESDCDFVWTKTACFADIAGAAQTMSSLVVPLVTVAVTDSGSNRNLQNRAVPAAVLAGQEGLPFTLSKPYVIGANSTMSFTLTNYSAATTYANLHFCLIGYKKFYIDPPINQ
jgi:hypothetical protein